MTPRDRNTPDRGPTQPAPGESSLWGEWYQRASPMQQHEALERAIRQGVLYAHQLAAPAHPAGPRRPPALALLNGSVHDLPPLHPPEPECHDAALDRTQREAVARALATPDVCLIQGFPGTGKSRVLTEIILQAARRGERVLFLAPTTAALDRVLERLGTRPAVCPLRCPAAEESPETIPAGVAHLTLAGRLRFYRENTVPAARAACDAARAARAARTSEEPVWTRLDEMASRDEKLAGRLRALEQRRAGLAAEVDAATSAADGPFRARWDACAREGTATAERLAGRLAGLRSELETITAKQGHLESEWQQVRPLVEARQGGRFWSAAWWRAVLRGGLAEQVRDLESRRNELEAARRRLQDEVAAGDAERAAVEQRRAADCRRLKDEEIARRQGELDAEVAAVGRERETLRESWRPAVAALAPEVAPGEMNRATVASARAEWERLRERQEQEAAAAEEWLRAVEGGLSTLPERLAGCANVVAATTTALPTDAHFGDRNGQPAASFDLLVLEEAHRVTESEFAAVARRAARCVLVGEPQPEEAPPTSPRRSVSSASLRPGFFQHLWRRLHADPRELPYAWTRNDGRLRCRLRPVSTENERWVESESVVDRPEIELRILSTPRQSPQVVEVVFPACVSLDEAKQFLFRELDELAVQTQGRSLCWTETPDDVILELAPDADPHAVTVPLGEGVRECVRGVAAAGRPGDEETLGDTCSLQFSRAAGWTRERAEQWVAERLGLHGTGRTVLLTVPYRLDPPLARFLSDLLFAGACRPPESGPGAALPRAAVEFVAVPSLASLEGRHRAGTEEHRNGGAGHVSSHGGGQAVSVRAPRLRSVKGGAGLEVDLADNRPLEQLPAELRAALPRRGLVNYLEALALIARLEALANDPAFRVACERWRLHPAEPCEHGCASPAACDCPRPDAGPAVAVMALYPAQVELLRQLIHRSPTLAGGPFAVEVGPPEAFGQRECLLALVSLTRSHGHRAVSYGEHPHTLTQALTRAASGLILFGDPGTLARRSQWHGALDHLDETAARSEASLVGRLVCYLQGHGRHPSAFHVPEGTGV